MQTILSKKNRESLVIILLFITTCFFFACQKQITGGGTDVIVTPVVVPDLSIKINSSVSGFVTDENNAAVMGATVTAGTSTASTDKYGYFEISNASVVKTAAVVTVSRPGYFKGIKTYTATANKSAFFRIKLLPKTISGNITAGTGGTVTLTNGLSVALPANSIVNNATGAAYTGIVNVAAYWISPTSPELNKIMPGDLRGIDTTGAMKILATYGMAAVELTGAAGELLQVAANKKATLTFPIPSTIAGKAPATIPLWYFDDANGLWKQQGNAIKTGGMYIGEVSHFSFWNCDRPDYFVQFSCTVVDVNGNAVPNVLVKISAIARDTQNVGYAYNYTDTTGFVAGAVPANAQLTLEVLGDYTCTNSVYTETFATTTLNVALGKIAISNANTANVTGNATNCTNAAVTNGYIILNKYGLNYRYPLSSTGTFSFSTSFCNNNPSGSIFAVDIDGAQQSVPATVTLTTGLNAVGTLTACGTAIGQFVNYTIDGVAYSFTYPADTIQQRASTDEYILAYNIGQDSRNMAIDFIHEGIAKNSSQALLYVLMSNINDSTNNMAPIFVHITEYGALNEFIAGNFSGSLTGAPPANKQYAITCNFRVRRRS